MAPHVGHTSKSYNFMLKVATFQQDPYFYVSMLRHFFGILPRPTLLNGQPSHEPVGTHEPASAAADAGKEEPIAEANV